jgi:hypothetical protein
MNLYYLTPANEYIEASYAPSDRAKCRKCKLGIEKGALRLGEIMEDDHFNAKYWYHYACFTLKPRFRHIDPEQQIRGIEDLD